MPSCLNWNYFVLYITNRHTIMRLIKLSCWQFINILTMNLNRFSYCLWCNFAYWFHHMLIIDSHYTVDNDIRTHFIRILYGLNSLLLIICYNILLVPCYIVLDNMLIRTLQLTRIDVMIQLNIIIIFSLLKLSFQVKCATISKQIFFSFGWHIRGPLMSIQPTTTTAKTHINFNKEKKKSNLSIDSLLNYHVNFFNPFLFALLENRTISDQWNCLIGK